MSSRPHLIQLDPNDDVTTVRDRLSFVRGERVLLVWPEDGTVLTRKLDLVLIQREAMRRAIRLAFVTHDQLVTQHANELNISTFETIGESERKRWKRGRSKVFTHRHQRPSDDISAEELQALATRTKTEMAESPIRNTITRIMLLIAFLVVIAIIAYALIPTATITVIPAQQVETATVSINAQPDITDIDIDNNTIPMTRLRIETVQEGTIATTGSVSLSNTRAVGSVVFINLTDDTIDIPANTVVSTSSGSPVQFRTLTTTELEGGVGLQVEAPIEALQDFAGEIGNVESGQINTLIGPLVESIEVRNTASTTGGETRTAKAVSADDLVRLEATVRQQIQALAFEEMQPLLSDTQFIILETLRIREERDDWKTFSAQAGDTTDTLSLTMRAVIEATAIDEQFGRQIAFAQLSNTIPRGREIRTNTINYERGTVTNIAADGSVTFDLTVSAMVVEPIDSLQIRQQIANRPISDALAYLVNEIDLYDNIPPTIRLTPAGMRRMPVLPARITINIEEPTA